MLGWRIDSLLAELDRVRQAWADLDRLVLPPGQRAELDLVRSRSGAAAWFDVQFEPRRRELRHLADSIGNGTVALGQLAESWAALDEIFVRLRGTLEEALQYMEGALGRAAGVDGGICRVADALLDEISRAANVPWNGTCVPAARELTSRRTWVIGIRYPDFRLWWLPIAVHELGHVAMETLEDQVHRRPFPVLVGGGWADDGPVPARLAGPFATELFADIFAAYTLGPAYPAALLWRASPRAPWSPARDNTHPGWGLRMDVALATLDDIGLGTWGREIRQQWDAHMAAVEAPAVPDDLRGDLDRFRAAVLAALRNSAPRGSFDAIDEALQVERIIRGDIQPGPGPRPRYGAVVNAAWLTRIRLGAPRVVDRDRDGAIETAAIGLIDARRDPAPAARR